MELYRKTRPENWSEMVGNSGTVAALKNEFKKEAPAQVFLLHGPSGTGKTTAARIAVKELGVAGSEIEEVNSSDARGIDSAREIIQKCRYQAFGGKRAFIIDETHRATVDWQNAMLKLLEDVPADTYFFLCTTDPQKLLKAVRTRCSEYPFVSLKPKEITKVVKGVMEKEGIELDPDVIAEISTSAEGSPRRAVKLMSKVVGIPDVDEALDIIMAGADEDTPEVRNLCQALLKGEQWPKVSKILKAVKGEDPENIRRAVLGYMTAVLLNKKDNQAALVIEEFSEPTYNTGFPGVVLAAYNSLFAE